MDTEPTIPGTEWVFGMADGTWGAWLCVIESGERYRESADSPGVYVDTTVPSETDDIDATARAIVGALALRLEDAIARHYARQQEGPPPLPSTEYLRLPHRRYLRTFYPLPRPEGGWPEPIPSFDDWLREQGITPAADLYRQHGLTASASTSGALPDSPPAASPESGTSSRDVPAPRPPLSRRLHRHLQLRTRDKRRSLRLAQECPLILLEALVIAGEDAIDRTVAHALSSPRLRSPTVPSAHPIAHQTPAARP